MKAIVFTLGCKVNQCESASIAAELVSRGYEVDDKLGYADIYFINTCAVTAEAEKKSRQTVARAKKYNPSARIIIFGCATQKDPTVFYEKEGVTVVSGTKEKSKIIDLLERQGIFVSTRDDKFDELYPVRESRQRVYVKVQDGCDNFCSYCIVPYLRGACRSRSVDSVRAEIEGLNAKEVVLTGINLSAYDREGKGLAGLICALKGIKPRIRLGSLEVGVITPAFLQACVEHGNVAPHFHLSLQSGSKRVLSAMNRKYTPEEYQKRVDLIRQYFPHAGITTDVIAGFPTETEAEFEESLAFIRKIGFADVHCFPYSRRTGTEAAKLPDTPPDVKKERLHRLLDVKQGLKKAFAVQNAGQTALVLPEDQEDGYVVGYTENYLKVYLQGERDYGDDFVNVEISDVFRDGAKAKIL